MSSARLFLSNVGGNRWRSPVEGMGQRVAFVTGVARGADALDATIQLCADLRQRGLIDRFVFSTWKDQRLAFEGVLAKLSPVTLVLSDEPQGIALLGSPIHQSRAWLAGLAVCAPNDTILKFRTDRSSPSIVLGLAQKASDQGLLRPDDGDGYPEVFARRPIVPYFNPNFPFLIHDIEFVARADDFAKLCNMDLAYQFLARAPSTEGFFYGSLFAKHIPLVRRLLSVNMRMLHKPESLAAWRRMTNLSRAWPWMQAMYLQIVKRYFDVGWQSANESFERDVARMMPEKTLTQLFEQGDPRIGVHKHNKYAGSVASSSVWLNYLHLTAGADPEDLGVWDTLNKRHVEEDQLDIDFATEAAHLAKIFIDIMRVAPEEGQVTLAREPDIVLEL